ncbi:MAG TPA: cyclic nucleotide-binding domain-containing protein [Chloroflexi bacterium]|nr:cyclic nucleotide-binding domain-containing protein [Chloroflexota bacterium]
MPQSKIDVLRQAFPDMEQDDLKALANVANQRNYSSDEVLCCEGDIGDTLYVIVSGQAEVTKQLDDEESTVLNRPGPGDFVGEIALVQETTRTATVRTVAPTTVLEINREDFVEMLHQSAPMAVRVMLTISPRLREIDQSLIAYLRQKNTKLTQDYQELQQKIRSS